MNKKVKEFEIAHLKAKGSIPDFHPGDNLRVAVRIKEGDKERIQNFEGICIRRSGDGLRETFTVRRVSYGVGMERVFPLHSPSVESITVVRKGKVRRAKLYYQRGLRGKKARIEEKRPGEESVTAEGAAPSLETQPSDNSEEKSEE
jgi:large subunit ribosomal protein L19